MEYEDPKSSEETEVGVGSARTLGGAVGRLLDLLVTMGGLATDFAV